MTQSTFINERKGTDRRGAFRFLAGIELGVLSKDCDRFGICKVEILDQLIYDDRIVKEGAYDCLALIGINESEMIDFYFLKQGMKACAEQKHFSGTKFILEESINIEGRCPCDSNSKTITKALYPDHYPILAKPWGYWVRIRGKTIKKQRNQKPG